MKKSLIIFATALILMSNTFAGIGDTVPAKIKSAFEKMFTAAQNVNWEKTSDLYFASFKLNDLDVKAVYNESAELMSTSRKINFNQLPLRVSMAIAGKYKEYNMPETAMEVVSDGQTAYHVNLESDKNILMLQSSNNGDITVDNRVKK